MNRSQNTTVAESLRDIAARCLSDDPGRPLPSAAIVSCPTQQDVDTPTTPEAKAALAAAVTATRFRVNTDLRTLISTDQARAIARTAVSAYVQQFRRVSEGGAQ